ncbi:MAG: hypothetical protein ACTS3R_09695 [Inquilinaceae bacterium]
MPDRFLVELAAKLSEAATDLRREARRRGDPVTRAPLITRAREMDDLATTALREAVADKAMTRQNRG